MNPAGRADLGSPFAVGWAPPAATAIGVPLVHHRDVPLVVLAVAFASVAAAARSRRMRGAVRERCTALSAASQASDVSAPVGSRRGGRRRAVVLDRWGPAVAAFGGCARRLARRPQDPDADRRIGGALVVSLVVLVVGLGPLVAAATGLVGWVVPLVAGIARQRRDHAVLVDELPEVVDLIRLGVGSGLNVRLALEAVVRHHDGRLAVELREVLARVSRGDRLADGLDTMTVAGAVVQPLVDALVATERDGAPLVEALDRVASDARTVRRRRREEAARRVPVKLLFPLVFCTLPAFALLTVVPVLLRSLPSLAP